MVWRLERVLDACVNSSFAGAGGVPADEIPTAESGSGRTNAACALGIAAAEAAERTLDVESDWGSTVTLTLFPPYLRKAFPESAAGGDGAGARDRSWLHAVLGIFPAAEAGASGGQAGADKRASVGAVENKKEDDKCADDGVDADAKPEAAEDAFRT